MDEAILERLIPVGDVFDTLAREYDRRGIASDWDACKQAALNVLLPRLLHGQTVAWATACTIDSDDPRCGNSGQIFEPMDFLQQPSAGEVPLAFWCSFSNAPATSRTFDPLTGDFSFEYVDGEFRYRIGHAFGVHLDRRGLPSVAASEMSMEFPKPKAAPLPKAIERNKGGAPRQYDWDRASAAVVFKWAEEGSWEPRNQADVERALADWFATQDKYPSHNSLKPTAKWLFEEFRQRAEQANNLAA